MVLTGGMSVIYDQVPNEFQPASPVVASGEFASFGLNSNGYETTKNDSVSVGDAGGSGFAESATSAKGYEKPSPTSGGGV